MGEKLGGGHVNENGEFVRGQDTHAAVLASYEEQIREFTEKLSGTLVMFASLNKNPQAAERYAKSFSLSDLEGAQKALAMMVEIKKTGTHPAVVASKKFEEEEMARLKAEMDRLNPR
jgi:ParB-like chromosome segregation protein Spo0J